MRRAMLLAALLLAASVTPAVATTPPPTPRVYAVFPGQVRSATLEQASVWIGVVFSDANYTGARLNLYLTPATATCQDFNKSPSWFEFDTTGATGHLKAYSSYWWAWHASSYAWTGKANCNRVRAWGNSNGGSVNGNPHSIANFGPLVNDDLLSLQIGRVG